MMDGVDNDDESAGARHPLSGYHYYADADVDVDVDVDADATTRCRCRCRCRSPMNSNSSSSSSRTDDMMVETQSLVCKFLLLDEHLISSPTPPHPHPSTLTTTTTTRTSRTRTRIRPRPRPRPRTRTRTRTRRPPPTATQQIISLLSHSTPSSPLPPPLASSSSPSTSLTSPSHSTLCLPHLLSDSDNDSSHFPHSNSNFCFTPHCSSHGAADSDSFSISAYGGGESDSFLDEHAFLDADLFLQPHFDTDDTDIDPMNAGLSHWDSYDSEQDGEDHEDGLAWAQDNDISRDTFPSPGFEGLLPRSFTRGYDDDIFASFEDSELSQFARSSADYLDARHFGELLGHLAESESSRRGAPPASMAFINSLPRVIMNDGHGKGEGLACAICKDILTIGTKVNQLPCLHLYHPSCILPWLLARNSCPLCRYEVPTDDKDYEDQKQDAGSRVMRIQEIQQHEATDNGSSDEGEMEERDLLGVEDPALIINSRVVGERTERGWFLLVAAPIVSMVGIVLVLWLGNSRGSTREWSNMLEQGPVAVSSPYPPVQRGSRSRKWWSFS